MCGLQNEKERADLVGERPSCIQAGSLLLLDFLVDVHGLELLKHPTKSSGRWLLFFVTIFIGILPDFW